MSDREHLAGVARTLANLADGLLQGGFVDPGESPTGYAVLQELKQDVAEADIGVGVDSKRIPLLFLQVMRIAALEGLLPTHSQEGDSSVSVDLTDISGGLELLQQISPNDGLQIRGVATAISVLMDYVYVVVAAAMADNEQDDLDIVRISRGAVAVAEISIRKALDGETRGRIAIETLRRCADKIEEELPEPDPETVEGEDGASGE